MKVSTLTRTLWLLVLTTLVTACGGGGGSDSDSGFTPPGARLTASPSSISMNTNSSATITVRGSQVNGAAVPDGTTVSASVSPASAGNIAGLTGTGAATATTSGGNAVFVFQSGAQPGSATITFSMADPNTPSRTITTSVSVQINSGPATDSRISFQTTAVTLPANPYFEQGYDPFLGSPYIAEVTVSARTASGQPFSGTDAELVVSINPVTVAAFSTLDDPTTTEVNEFENLLGTGPVEVNAGQATIFVHSLVTPGTAILSVSFTDPDTGQQVLGQLAITVAPSAPPLPANVTIFAPQRPIYVQGSGGTTFAPFSVHVEDGSGEEVPDPVAGNTAFNNVRIEIIGDGIAAGERLAGVNAQGQNVEGSVISLRTHNGIATATFRAGTRTGTTVIRATADRADNNVDNGITDPVVSERSIVISDGRLFSLEITTPSVRAIFVNPVDPNVNIDPETGVALPNQPDGTYSLTVGVIATDRLGNPVLPGTVINFGLIDEPQVTGSGDFQIAGNDGNPQEAGTLFTAPGGAFRTAGGGAGPGDTLVLFGEEVDGNRDHESARTVANVNSQTSLNVTRRFNRNDDTGVVVDFGPVLPYVIGRATDGNIVAQGTTNELGIARTILNYPISQLGKRIIIWAQGDGAIFNGTPETIADVEFAAFAGIAPATISASPSSIPANGTSVVTVCVADALGAGITQAFVGFAFEDFSGTGSVDGVSGSGTVPTPTDQGGCVTVDVTTSGVLEGDGEPRLVFFFGDATDDVTLTFADLILQARPSTLGSTGGTVTLTLINGSGAPQPGFQIVGSCETSSEGANVGISSGPGVTNANGQTTATITASGLSQPDAPGEATCTFSTADDSATVDVTLQGQDACTPGFSPPPPTGTCADDPADTQFDLTTSLSAGAAVGSYTVTSSPAGLSCSVTDVGGTTSCTAPFATDTFVTLTASGPAGSTFVGWSGDCAPSGAQATVTMNAAKTCAADWD